MDIFFTNYSLMALETNWLNDTIGKFFIFVHNTVNGIITNTNISYGVTIILVTIIIRLVLFPLNYKQIKSQTKMNEIQPEMKRIQEKYKSNPEKQQQELMKLYKDNEINPVGGCLPLLLQWPILIALYYVFNNLATIDPNISDATFLGLRLMDSATFSNPATLILPLLSGALTYLSTAINMPKGDNAQASQTKIMNITMTGLITWMSFKFSAALVIYWVTNSLFQIGQTLAIKKKKTEVKTEYKEVKSETKKK